MVGREYIKLRMVPHGFGSRQEAGFPSSEMRRARTYFFTRASTARGRSTLSMTW